MDNPDGLITKTNRPWLTNSVHMTHGGNLNHEKKWNWMQCNRGKYQPNNQLYEDLGWNTMW